MAQPTSPAITDALKAYESFLGVYQYANTSHLDRLSTLVNKLEILRDRILDQLPSISDQELDEQLKTQARGFTTTKNVKEPFCITSRLAGKSITKDIFLTDLNGTVILIQSWIKDKLAVGSRPGQIGTASSSSSSSSKPPLPPEQALAAVRKAYAEFQDTFNTAQTLPSNVLSHSLDHLRTLQTTINANLNHIPDESMLDKELSGKKQGIRTEIQTKIALVISKLPASSFSSSPARLDAVVIKGCVGYQNSSNNCWANAMLQYFQHVPSRRTAYRAVAEFLATGRDLDTLRKNRILDLCRDAVPIGAQLEEAKRLFRAISFPSYKVLIAHELAQLPHFAGSPVLREFFTALPAEYRNAVNETLAVLEMTLPAEATQQTRAALLSEAINNTFEEQGAIYRAAADQQSTNNKAAGASLLQILNIYAEAAAQKQSVPGTASQNLRQVFNYLYGTENVDAQGHSHEIFSRSAGHQEDAVEAMNHLLTTYEEIHTLQGQAIPASHFPLELTKVYEAVGEPRPANPAKLAKNGYSVLTPQSTSVSLTHDNQLILDPATAQDTPILNLLQNYFVAPQAIQAGDELATYLLPDGREQSFRKREERRVINNIPDELNVVLKRFGQRADGAAYKITTRVLAHQVIALPGTATRDGIPLAYQLDSFIVHTGPYGGGHYISYRKVDGTWIEFNDSALREMSNREIDDILQGRRGEYFTPYSLHYAIVPRAQQAEMLLEANDLATRPIAPVTTATTDTLSHHQATIVLLQNIEELLKETPLNPAKIKEALGELHKHSPQTLSQIHYQVWLNNGMPAIAGYGQLTCDAHPESVAAMTASWIKTDAGNVIAQLRTLHQQNLESERLALKTAQLLQFIGLIESSQVTEEALVYALRHRFPKDFIQELFPSEEVAIKAALDKGTLKEFLQPHVKGGKDLNRQLLSIQQAEKALDLVKKRDALNALHALLLNAAITDLQIKEVFSKLPRDLQELLLLQIGKADSSKASTITFQANPRCLLQVIEHAIQDLNAPDAIMRAVLSAAQQSANLLVLALMLASSKK